MDGENNGSKPYEQMDDLGGKNPPLFLVQHPYDVCSQESCFGIKVLQLSTFTAPRPRQAHLEVMSGSDSCPLRVASHDGKSPPTMDAWEKNMNMVQENKNTSYYVNGH